jgi:hypothetical protein
VTFIGDLFGGGTVSNSFTLDGLFGSQTFVFSGFGSVTKMSWGQDPQFVGQTHQFDNIVASANNGTAVPEPASL